MSGFENLNLGHNIRSQRSQRDLVIIFVVVLVAEGLLVQSLMLLLLVVEIVVTVLVLVVGVLFGVLFGVLVVGIGVLLFLLIDNVLLLIVAQSGGDKGVRLSDTNHHGSVTLGAVSDLNHIRHV